MNVNHWKPFFGDNWHLRRSIRVDRCNRSVERRHNKEFRKQGRMRFHRPYRNSAFELKYYERQPPFRGS